MTPGTRVVAVVNLKGGTGKTTTSAFLLHALAKGKNDQRRRTTGVDADPHGQLLRWAGLAGWSLPVLGLPTPTLHRQLWGVVDADRVDVVVIDTPPLEERAGVVASVLRVATDVIVPTAPTMMDLDRIAPVWVALAEAAGHRDDDPTVRVLLTRTIPNAASTDTIREILTEHGRPVMTATIPRLERYAQAYGGPVDPLDSRYAAVADELTGDWA